MIIHKPPPYTIMIIIYKNALKLNHKTAIGLIYGVLIILTLWGSTQRLSCPIKLRLSKEVLLILTIIKYLNVVFPE